MKKIVLAALALCMSATAASGQTFLWKLTRMQHQKGCLDIYSGAELKEALFEGESYGDISDWKKRNAFLVAERTLFWSRRVCSPEEIELFGKKRLKRYQPFALPPEVARQIEKTDGELSITAYVRSRRGGTVIKELVLFLQMSEMEGDIVVFDADFDRDVFKVETRDFLEELYNSGL